MSICICIILMYMIVYMKYKNHLFPVRQKFIIIITIQLASDSASVPKWREKVPFQPIPLPGSCLAHHLHILLAPEAVT